LGVEDRGFGYQPIDYLTLKQAFAELPIRRTGTNVTSTDVTSTDVTSTDVTSTDITKGAFVDFGCGKGRPLLFAAMHGFDTVCGVEFNAELAEIARTNLDSLQSHRRCRQHQVVHSDATEFTIPDNATVLFFYNPFAGAILQTTLDNIYESLQRTPRDLTIIYALPKFDPDLMASTPWLTKSVDVKTCNSDWERLTIYRSKPAETPQIEQDVTADGQFASDEEAVHAY